MSRAISVYDYVDHPYGTVRDKLTEEAAEVFRRATNVAALRAKSVAAELHVSIAGIEVGADIEITVESIEEQTDDLSSPVTIIEFEWSAAKMPGLFPLMKAELFIYPLTPTETQLSLAGHYDPPLGGLGKLIDDVLMHRIAEASVHQFLTDVAAYLRKKLAS